MSHRLQGCPKGINDDPGVRVHWAKLYHSKLTEEERYTLLRIQLARAIPMTKRSYDDPVMEPSLRSNMEASAGRSFRSCIWARGRSS
jgi:hypothetical protein